MDPANNDGAPPAATTPAPTTPDPATPTPASGDEAAAPSKQDWAQFKKDQRQLVDNIKSLVDAVKSGGRTADPPKPAGPSATPTPVAADAATDRIANLERKAELGVVYADLGIKAGPQRDFIEVATKSLPADAVRSFVESYMKTLPAPSAPAAPAAPAPKPVTAPINTGAPGTTNAPPDPGDLAVMDAATFNALPREERVKRVNEYRSRGPNQNPYAGSRVRELTRGGRK